ncbi:adenylate kinase [Patescibacteria group bacterium]|nr:adenylate kinase [Patescibacteria group bacterium]
MFNIIIFGPPGAGKGTQAQKISESYDLMHLSTGALLRKEVANQTKIGIEVQAVMANGDLVSNNIVDEIIKNEINKNGQVAGFIFDGYPRTIQQAKQLDKLFTAENIPLVLNLEVSDEELINRLKLRSQESGRADDNDVTIANRLQVYTKQTQPLLNFYANKNRLISIDGQGSIEEIFKRLQKQIKNRQ